ncbi:hypothetical protein ZWY2020_039394 [Hordeum vulgare]|nr:hypothetical protein ZWY2020_039394 [Hordeum vulgare]
MDLLLLAHSPDETCDRLLSSHRFPTGQTPSYLRRSSPATSASLRTRPWPRDTSSTIPGGHLSSPSGFCGALNW